jgi:hypothetical protein
MFAAFGHPQKDDLGDRWLERDCSCSQGVEAREQLGACRAVARGRQPQRRRSRQWKRLQHESHRKSVHCEEMGPQNALEEECLPTCVQWSLPMDTAPWLGQHMVRSMQSLKALRAYSPQQRSPAWPVVDSHDFDGARVAWIGEKFALRAWQLARPTPSGWDLSGMNMSCLSLSICLPSQDPFVSFLFLGQRSTDMSVPVCKG